MQIYDNPVIQINGQGKERLATALTLSIKDKAVGWAVRDNTLVFFWTDPSRERQNQLNYEFHKFPSPADHTAMADIAWNWLENLPHDTWEPTGDDDIWLRRGWLVYTDMWGHIDGFDWQSFIAVKPYSLWVGK